MHIQSISYEWKIISTSSNSICYSDRFVVCHESNSMNIFGVVLFKAWHTSWSVFLNCLLLKNVQYVFVTTWGIFLFPCVVSVYLILTLSTGDPFDANPPQSEHGAVVIDMQEADMVELLTQDEKHSVEVLHTFRNKVPPQGCGHLPSQEKTWGTAVYIILE